MKYGSDPKGKGKFTKYDDPKKREANKNDVMQSKATEKERMREGSRGPSGAPKKAVVYKMTSAAKKKALKNYGKK